DDIALVAAGIDDDPGGDGAGTGFQLPAALVEAAAGDAATPAHAATMGEALLHIGKRCRPGIDDMFARHQDGTQRMVPKMRLARLEIAAIDLPYIGDVVLMR